MKTRNFIFEGTPKLCAYGKKYPPIGFGANKWGQENIEIANTACIIQNMILTATELGLGSAYLTGFISCFTQNPSLTEKLGIPKGFFPIAGMLVGHINGNSRKMKASKTIGINYCK